jgi:hypothetical protein
MTITTGNLVVVWIMMGNGFGQTSTSVTDTHGNTYTRIPATHAFNATLDGGTSNDIWYASNVTGGTGAITAHWTSVGGFAILEVNEYSGVALTSALDVGTGSVGNAGSNVWLGPVTLASTNELVVAFWLYSNTLPTTAPGFTDRGGTAGIGVGSNEDSIVSLAGAFTVKNGGPGSTAWLGAMAAFKTVAVTVNNNNLLMMMGCGT